ncbi:MAG: hypothetical protein LAO08_09800 [Acidobacteriia bacterium]|nr:hypothetical protein [Terriglobia bacterium]
MKLRIRLPELAALAAIAWSAVALAQNVPQQFVVSGKAAEKIQDFTTINLATAGRIAEVCEEGAAAHSGQHTIMILDKAGNHVYMDRMDGHGLSQYHYGRDEGAHRASGTRAQQELHERSDPGSGPRI